VSATGLGLGRLGNHLSTGDAQIGAVHSSLTGHLNRGINGVFEIDRVYGQVTKQIKPSGGPHAGRSHEISGRPSDPRQCGGAGQSHRR
jgi:hypothetical protein